MKQLLLMVCVSCLIGATAIEAAKPAPEPSSVTLLTPNPSLGATVYFGVQAPAQAWKSGILIALKCIKIEDPPQPDPRIGWIIYGETRPWEQGFVLGGGDSTWATTFPTSNTHCIAESFYTVRQAGQQQIRWLAFTEFDAPGQQP